MSLVALLFFSTQAFAGFINPMDFDGSDAQKKEVVAYIKARVKKDYCDSGIDMCQEVILRMMEQENLKAFKSAAKSKNRKIMDRVIKDYCDSGIDMCNYTTIFMMYQENLKAADTELTW
ncbi:hypothetical protein EOL70_03140 [Leucothrix sargassi]|nr:hypothetical protein EOL70_03140 [Leucothrix sargassi]